MGTPKDKVHFKEDGEGPVRRVRMSGFRLDKFEVSNRKFEEFVAATGYTTEAEGQPSSLSSATVLCSAIAIAIAVEKRPPRCVGFGD
eukprot:SAG31_NODE_27032_length_432_cov_0.918919_1_plen_86_part_01